MCRDPVPARQLKEDNPKVMASAVTTRRERRRRRLAGKENGMSYYVIQSKTHPWSTTWTTWPNRRFDTLAEAQAAFEALPVKADRRIAEAYTVTRYKPVKGV